MYDWQVLFFPVVIYSYCLIVFFELQVLFSVFFVGAAVSYGGRERLVNCCLFLWSTHPIPIVSMHECSYTFVRVFNLTI